MVSNGLEAEIYRFENLKFPYKKKRGNVKIEGKFRAPIRNTCKLAKPIMTSTLALFINGS
jgi:hypothetical protein